MLLGFCQSLYSCRIFVSFSIVRNQFWRFSDVKKTYFPKFLQLCAFLQPIISVCVHVSQVWHYAYTDDLLERLKLFSKLILKVDKDS